MSKSYCSIESHSSFSLLDGYPAPEVYFRRAKECGIDGIAITDHCSLAGALDVYKAAGKYGIKGICGIEENIYEENPNGEKTRGYSHLLIFPKNEVGWKNLLYLNYLSTTEDRAYYKPRIRKQDLFEHAEGLVVSSNCIGSVVPRKIFSDVNAAARSNTYEEATQHVDSDWEKNTKQLIEEYKHVFKDDFYMGANIHNLAAQKLQLDIVRELCIKYNVKCVVDCDAHYSHPEDAKWQEALICLSTGKTIHQRDKLRQEGNDLLFGDNSSYYLYTPQEMLERFTEQELGNTYEIFSKCQFKLTRQNPVIPTTCDNPHKVLSNICLNKLNTMGLNDNQTYIDRLKEELSLFIEFNLSGYMLLVKDIFEEAHNLNILITPRGSVGGSLVAYLIGILPLDPIKYNLLFVRFLNRGRMSPTKTSLPDVDFDVDSEKRHILINRLKDKFGHDKVAQMSTFGYLGARGSIKDAFRITSTYDQKDEYQAVAEKIVKHIPNKMPDEPDVTIENVLETSEAVKNYAEQYPEQFEYAKHLEGCIRANSVHAAGVVISNQPLVEQAPIHYHKKMGLVTNCEMSSAEEYGLVKMDLLGLRNLSSIDHANQLYESLNEKTN